MSFPQIPLVDLVVDRQISYGVVQPGSDSESGIPIVRVKDVRNGIIDTAAPMRVDASIEAKHVRTRLAGGELLLSIVGTVGESAVVPNSLAGWNVARAIAVIRPAMVSPRWLQLCFDSPDVRSYLDGVLNTTVQATLNLSDLKSVPVPVPSASVRQAITEVLGALDDKIAANTKLAATADEFLAAHLSKILEIGFDEVRLGDVAEVNAGTVKPSAGGSLRYIDIASVGVGSHEFPELTPWDDAPSRARRKVGRGDTLWSTVRPGRRSHSLNLSEDPLLVGSTGLAVLSPIKVGFAYLYEVTKTPDFTAYLENVAEGSAYPAVRADRFSEAIIPMISPVDLERFESLAGPIRQQLHTLSVENRTLAQIRDALLPQLMSGKLRVEDAEALASAVV